MEEQLSDKNLLDVGIDYLSRGWSVLPVGADKRPLLSSWKEYQERRASPEELEGWLTLCPDMRLAVVTGRISGVVALDVDVKNGHQGKVTLADLEAEYGALPDTLQQQTASGGDHYLFSYPAAGVKNSAGTLGDGIDIRGDGGYIVVSPSLGYTWVVGHDPQTMPLAPMPAWLLERVESAGATKPSTAIADVIPVGQRNNTLFRRGSAMRRSGFGSEAILSALQDTNARQCRPPLDDREVEVIAHQAASYAPAARLIMRVDHDGEPLPGELPLSDAGNAGRMVLLYADRFRWVSEEKLWLYWDKTRWARDRLFEVQRLAIETARAIQRAALMLDSPDARIRILRHGVRSESAQGIDGMVKVARYLPGITIESRVLDSERDLVNVVNGTLDLVDFTLRPHDPADLLTRRLEVAYDPAAQAPSWQRFLRDVFHGRQEVIDYVQRAVGYTLTGSILEQCVFILHGSGANGKSTFVAALNALFGEYSVDAGAETFLASTRNEGRGPEPELMRLKGMRFAYVDELPEGRALDEERVKKLTGGETTSGRDLYKSTETFDNTAKIWLDLNHLPRIEGVDYGIERRIRVIPFDRKFEEHEQDKQMLDKLKTELPGILAWAVEGCRAWREQGLQAPEVVGLATRRYRDEHNHLPAFVEAYYELQPGSTVSASTLQEEYAGFCAQRDEVKLDYRTKVVRFLEDALRLTRAKTRQGVVWQGIRPRTERAM